ncbi:SDR family NAD(P)-dependent oxidoreductase [bacterium]|nr:SDR family NAD(P)-dependent oxidoreductase [bacterium]NBX83714.1 SDR family NAD(P)-dependent oxidoreductase [bacterium]
MPTFYPNKMEILVTGSAGFIGSHLSQRLLAAGFRVSGVDLLGASDPLLKFLQEGRLAQLRKFKHFNFLNCDIRDRSALSYLFKKKSFSQVIHLAGRAGVRESFDKTEEYLSINVKGTAEVIRLTKDHKVGHFIFTSSSSVYGEVKGLMSEFFPLKPISPYGKSKLLMEKKLLTYADNCLRITGFRPFSVYGPWGRPDMAYFKYTQQMTQGTPIELYNQGAHLRDFTFIDDVVEGLFRATLAYERNHISHVFKMYNLGKGKPEPLLQLVKYLETNLGIEARLTFSNRQQGDVGETFADTSELQKDFKFTPQITLEEGIKLFIQWWSKTLGLKGNQR